MIKKKSFIVHIDSLAVLDELSDEQAGKLFRAMKSFHLDEELELDGIMKIAFSPFKNQFIRDNEKYLETCKRRAEAGSMGGKAKANSSKQMLANASKCQQDLANLADSDSKNKKDNKSKTKEILDYVSVGFTKDQFETIKRVRKLGKPKNQLTNRILKTLANELAICAQRGIGFDACMEEWEYRGWQSFKSEWMRSGNWQTNQAPVTPKPDLLEIARNQ